MQYVMQCIDMQKQIIGTPKEIMRKTLNDHTIIPIISMYLDGNNLYRWRMSQKLPVNGFKLERKTSINLMNNSLKTIMLIVIILE